MAPEIDWGWNALNELAKLQKRVEALEKRMAARATPENINEEEIEAEERWWAQHQTLK